MAIKRRASRKIEVSSRIRHVWETVTTALALLTGVYLILTTIEPTRAVLERYVGKLDQQGLVALVAVMLEVATIAVYQLGREVRSLRAAVATRAGEEVTHTITEVLSAARWDGVGRRRRRVEVLGLTLNTTWPVLVTWLTTRDRLAGWHLVLYCLDPAFVERSGELPAEWAEEARRSQGRVRAFLAEEGEELRRRGVTVELKSYACVPIAHGFRFGDGTVFLSYLQWSDNGRIRPFEFYDRIAPDDTSPRAGHYRDLYDSWLARAEAKVVQPARG
ncbi:hypothetical protein [Saccharothrix australiensis]|uniref:Uncharacterized protein n=1 Tax=Saccharothrix australiensis TaxID=2072 RepID=A0A495VVP9_9PSEU|nr:hypothetical protein [Saccharothrix australiensis]RKT52445.1 hypothetical protein C8E97_0957 [Saccharothrix australiensis]